MASDPPSTQSAATTSRNVTFDMGLLFVHGIGSQRRGQTLADFGEPIFCWLEDRFLGLDQRWREATEGQKDLDWRSQVEVWATEGFRTEDHPKAQASDLLNSLGYDPI